MRYCNPVYDDYFADPFVWKVGAEYFAVGTGREEVAGVKENAGWVFSMLHSRDLIHWEPLGEALERPDPAFGGTFWAPEVAAANGRYWMYYSVGFGDKHHQIRVAVADDPRGPYHDAKTEPIIAPDDPPFAIDAHPFRDADGQWYLFYARDFLEGDRPGTALACDRLEAMDCVSGHPWTVLRAGHDWQRFQADRPMYGGRYDWHTLEGPAVIKHGQKYYLFFSAGRWENETYGVDYAVADQITGPWTSQGNETGARILHTIPGKVIGPGHNSIVTGPDGKDYIAYHAWDANMARRQLCISPISWTRQGPRCKSEPA